MTTRIVHMHIPKTAGTSVNRAFESHYAQERVFTGSYEPDFNAIDVHKYDFYRGHIGYELASTLEANIVCVLRDPIDRFLSVYYYWQQLYQDQQVQRSGVKAAAILSLDEFVERFDEIALIEELYNRMTWQVACDYRWEFRRDYLEFKSEEILQRALQNLNDCAVVGRLENMPRFAKDVYDRLGVKLDIDHINVTRKKTSKKSIPLSTRRKIMDWVHWDLELYWSYDKRMQW